MKTFLQLVAEDLYNKVGADMSKVAVVFPNKRAGLFFNDYLAACSDSPVWAPAYISISDLLQQLSVLKLADPIRLVCELYRIFAEETGSGESLDEFYFWGELLIADFDDLDKNLVDADKLLTNLQDLRNVMGNSDFLDEEQEEAVQQFFQNFSMEKRTLLKERFMSLWDQLGPIYHRFRNRLEELGIAYEGMLYRQVIESLQTDQLPYEHYVLVGFNVLNRVENRFFALLQEAGKAWFYWDYDRFYTQMPGVRHEAGEFVLRNLKQFPNELPEKCFDCLSAPKQVRFLSAPTENAQARFLPQWIKTEMNGEERENAVVLCNEALLLPVLHALPPTVKHVNVTMGFPLSQTPVFSLVNALLELQLSGYAEGRFRHEAVRTVLKHPYVDQLSETARNLEKELTVKNRFFPKPSELQKDEFLKTVFTPIDGGRELCIYIARILKSVTFIYRKDTEENSIFDQLYRESLFKVHTMVGRLHSLIEEGTLTVRTDTLVHLLNRLMAAASIPFHGEPAIGMQVMGVLETRNLDFRNLLLLSLNEGKLPKSGGEASFIPYNLRKAFGMTTIEHKNAVYAYYFYRLIQRAERITMVYNTASDGMNRGEWSRFMLQFLVEWPHEIRQEYLEAGQSPAGECEIRVEKTPAMLERLYRKFNRKWNIQAQILSPSALNMYLDCRLKFYFRHVAGLKAPDEVSAEIDSALFGTIFHRSAQLAYTSLSACGEQIRKEDLERLIKDDITLQNFVDQAFREHLFHVGEKEKVEYNGTQLINSKVIVSYLRQLLRNDLQYVPFRMVAMEKEVEEEMKIQTSYGELTLALGGTIDRMDSKEGQLRIVDYKTGGTPKIPVSLKQLFTPAEDRPNYVFQTFLYAAIMCRQQPEKVAPALLYIHKASNEQYSPVIEMGEPRKPKEAVTDFSTLEKEFRELLENLIQEIFGKEEPFVQTEFSSRCAFCDYRSLCRR